MHKIFKGFNLSWCILFFFLGIISVPLFQWGAGRYAESRVPEDIEKNTPYYEEVKKIIEPLRYSGFNSLMMRNAGLSIDFGQKKWALHNIHRFDENGKVLLPEGRYGVCGELAAYTYDKIRPIFPKEYDIKFISLSESGYFLHPRASHLALIITKRSLFGSETYLLDPSFHNYGRINHFDEYAFFDESPSLDFVEKKDTSQEFKIGSITPILIKKDFLVGLVVDETGGKFDRNNFLIAVTATKRFKYAGRYILAFRRVAGQPEVLENKRLALNILSPETYDKLKEKVSQLYANLP